MRLAVIGEALQERLFLAVQGADDLGQHLLGPQAVEPAHPQVVHDQLVAEPLRIDAPELAAAA